MTLGALLLVICVEERVAVRFLDGFEVFDYPHKLLRALDEDELKFPVCKIWSSLDYDIEVLVDSRNEMLEV